MVSDGSEYANSEGDESSSAVEYEPVRRTVSSMAATKAMSEVTHQSGNQPTNKSSTKTTEMSAEPKTVEDIYQKKSQIEHVLLRPDTYVGSIEPDTRNMYVAYGTDSIISKSVTFTPGLFKIFDEIIVNASDNAQRDSRMDRLEVTISTRENKISVFNNGAGIPVQVHKKYNMYIPTMIFGHLLTSSNYNDDEKKTTGGRNGYGAKLANIFSKEFMVECVDTKNGKHFTQTWNNNMSSCTDPKIRKTKAGEQNQGDHVRITFVPDLEKFGMERLDDDTTALLQKRVIDIAGTVTGIRAKGSKKFNVYLNGQKLQVKSFKEYLTLYPHLRSPKDILAYDNDDRWEVAVAASDGVFTNISFVNGINTSKGGMHVNYIADQVTAHLSKALAKKHKSEIKPAQIKNHLHIACNCLIDNPAFSSQTKETLTTKNKNFGSKFQLSNKTLKSLEKGELADAILSYATFKQQNDLKKKSGTKKMKLSIGKLDDANFAGGAKSNECTLILTEGDSAKSLAMSGLSIVGRDKYGVFPLKGKPLNVRDAPIKTVLANEELKNLVDIMGLKYHIVYTAKNIKTLRYGHLMIMADQDHDGSHIKGLIINFLHFFWPSLLNIPNFLQCFITPIVKCTNKRNAKDILTFFNLPEYDAWQENGVNVKNYSAKYYKGLGTSTSAEAKEYFSNLDIHEVHFSTLVDDVGPQSNLNIGNSGSIGDELIEMVFSKKKVMQRKSWLNNYKSNTFLSYSADALKYSNFINRELILFSRADNIRSLPHIYDGFKPSQRKVLFSCFKRNLKEEIKVAQLAGYVSEVSAYHHGEASLAGTIIGMAQNFVGSNNINLLVPSGQFGTRRMGGKDCASPRYIYTALDGIARKLFHPDDDALLKCLKDDGLTVEPEYYMPIIPMILVNGSEGIGTGWSTSIPNFDPRQIIANLRRLINGEEMEPMTPWYHGYAGEITEANKAGSYDVRGNLEHISRCNKLKITELPLKRWTQDYKQFLESLQTSDKKADKEPDVKDFVENHTDTSVSFTITTSAAKIDEFGRTKGGIYGKLKLSGKLSTSNMQMFNEDGAIQKFDTPLEIMLSFFEKRLDFYVKRKALLLQRLCQQETILSNKARFILAVCEGRLVLSNRKKVELLSDLKEMDFQLLDNSHNDESEGEDDDLASGYSYLLNMKIWSLTYEKVKELKSELASTKNRIDELRNRAEHEFWLEDLDALEDALNERDADLEVLAKEERSAKKRNSKRNAKKHKNSSATKKKNNKKDEQYEWDTYALSDSSEDEVSNVDEFIAPNQHAAVERKSSFGHREITPRACKKAIKTSSDTLDDKQQNNSKMPVPSVVKSTRKVIIVDLSSDEGMDTTSAVSLKQVRQKISTKFVVDAFLENSDAGERKNDMKRSSTRLVVSNIDGDSSDDNSIAETPVSMKVRGNGNAFSEVNATNQSEVNFSAKMPDSEGKAVPKNERGFLEIDTHNETTDEKRLNQSRIRARKDIVTERGSPDASSESSTYGNRYSREKSSEPVQNNAKGRKRAFSGNGKSPLELGTCQAKGEWTSVSQRVVNYDRKIKARVVNKKDTNVSAMKKKKRHLEHEDREQEGNNPKKVSSEQVENASDTPNWSQRKKRRRKMRSLPRKRSNDDFDDSCFDFIEPDRRGRGKL